MARIRSAFGRSNGRFRAHLHSRVLESGQSGFVPASILAIVHAITLVAICKPTEISPIRNGMSLSRSSQSHRAPKTAEFVRGRAAAVLNGILWGLRTGT